MKKFLHYLGSTLFVCIILYMGMKYHFHLKKEAEATYQMLPLLFFAVVSPIVIGMVLRLPKLILEILERKRWTFDWAKIVAVGLPALYVAMLPYVYYTQIGGHLPLAKEFAILEYSAIPTAAGIIFGYVLLDSFKKPD
ncbi:hypothetical protein [Bacillus sp. FJAT-27245]|uniref:hypothetical protein n=1 Tax=Bacillus sp. FJAT-27245 TaxID=1684144 RepID=UPI0006A76AA1|nr:hypothetical protein [Bacillus sp. FJAT-27245]